MYNVSAAFLEEVKKPIIQCKIWGAVGSESFTEYNIVSGSFHITNQCTDTSDVVLGSVYTGTLSAVFCGLSISRYSWVGKIIQVYFSLKLTSTWEDVPLGFFTIKEAKHTAEGVEVTAYDNMIKFDRKFDAKNFRTAKKMYGYITDVCGICGVHFGMTEQQVQALPNGNTKIGIVGTKSNKELKEFGNDIDTYRDLLFWMAQTMACFATINREGELVFRQYKDGENADDEVTEYYRIAGAEFDDFTTNYTGIYVKNTKSGNDIYYGYDVAALQQEITETEDKIVSYGEDLDEAAEKYAHGEITEAEYRRIVKNLEKKTKQAETRLQWLEDALVKAQNGEDGLFMDLGENPFLQPDGIGTQYPEMRRRILNALDVISYTPFSCSTVFGVHYDLGDIIQFTGGHATNIGETCCLMAYDYTFNGEYVMQGFGSDPSKPVIKEKTAKSANKADKNGVSGGRTSVGSSVPTEGSEGDVHFQTNDDTVVQNTLSLSHYGSQNSGIYKMTIDFNDNGDGTYDFTFNGYPDWYGNGETAWFNLQNIVSGRQYTVIFDVQVTKADGGWIGSWQDKLTICGTPIVFNSDFDLHHYEVTFTGNNSGQARFTFQNIADAKDYTMVFTDFYIIEGTVADKNVIGTKVYHNDEWKNVDYVRKVTQVVTSGTQVATAENSDGTNTGIYVPNMSGASASAAGSNGLVPAPASGDESKFLRGDGTWQNAGGGGSDLELEIDNGEIVATYGAQTEETEPILKDSTGDDIVTMLEAIATEMGALASPEIYAPVVYSLEERVIGVWTDGKPLYQKTIYSTSQVTLVDTEWRTIPWVNAPSNVENLIHAKFARIVPYSNAFYRFYADSGVIKGAAYVTYAFPPTQAPLYVTIEYTKTTDIAGSGNYAALGVPAVHYDDTEKVIGTWFGETLYQKTFSISGGVACASNTWVNTGISIPVGVSKVIRSIASANSACNASIIASCDNPTIYIMNLRNASVTIVDFTIEYTKTS